MAALPFTGIDTSSLSSGASSAWSSATSGIGSALGGWAAEGLGLNDSTREANAEYQAQLLAQQYAYYIQGLKESPSAYREGLEAAGYNPILAVNSGASAGSFHGSGGSAPQLDRSGSGGATAAMTNKILASEASSAQSRAEIDKAGVPAAKAESAVRVAQAENDRLMAEAYHCAVNGIEPEGCSPMFRDLIKKFENQVERDRYLQSREHAIYEDINTGVNSAASLIRGGAAVKSAMRPPSQTHIQNKHYNLDNSQHFDTYSGEVKQWHRHEKGK